MQNSQETLGMVLGVLVLRRDGLQLVENAPEPLRTGDFVRVQHHRVRFAQRLLENKDTVPFELAELLLARRVAAVEAFSCRFPDIEIVRGGRET